MNESATPAHRAQFIHRFEGLGDFVEIEVVLRPGQRDADGAAVAQRLRQALGTLPEHCFEAAYVDLLNALAPR